jgi:hypothetical protein
MAELDNNDKALVQYFLRGMRRFEKHVRAQDVFAVETLEAVEGRIETAYQLARTQLKPAQKP